MMIILLGAPGAGKGTQAEKMAAYYGLHHLSTGDLLRAAVADGTELGRTAQEYMNAGTLVPDDVIIGVIRDYMTQHHGEGLLFDGFPRTVAQAEGLEALLNGSGVRTVALQVADEAVVERLSSRRVCRSCGKVYNAALGIMPEGEGCECGGELYQREDDREETIRRRLEVYHDQTEPIIGFYRERGRLVEVNGSGTPDEVFSRIQAALG